MHLMKSEMKRAKRGQVEKSETMVVEEISDAGKAKDINGDCEEEMVLPGFRFHPTDEELVGFYLRRKVENKRISVELIKQVDIYKHDPWDLPKVSTVGDNKEWYFFCMRGRKYRNSVRPNRVTGSGFWKATGIDKPLYSSSSSQTHHNHHCIGLKKSLVYYRGSAGKGTKTDWMMHEFRLPPTNWNITSNQFLNPKNNTNTQEAEVWTLCRIFKRTSNYKRCTPDWKQQTIVKQKIGDASSKACSFGSDNSDDHSNLNFRNNNNAALDGISNRIDQRLNPHCYNNNQTIMSSVLPDQSSFTSSNSNFWNTSSVDQEEYLFTDGNWDELKSVVDFAIDPNSTLYGCR